MTKEILRQLRKNGHRYRRNSYETTGKVFFRIRASLVKTPMVGND